MNFLITHPTISGIGIGLLIFLPLLIGWFLLKRSNEKVPWFSDPVKELAWRKANPDKADVW